MLLRIVTAALALAVPASTDTDRCLADLLAWHTCSLDGPVGIDPDPEYHPWTHRPHCRLGIHPTTRQTQEYCLYTRANSTTQHGVSILTSPTTASEILAFSRFDEYDRLRSHGPYEKRTFSRRGIGLVATRDVKMGETIMQDIPSLIVDSDVALQPDQDEWTELIWRGLLQLPEMSRSEIRALAGSRGGDPLNDILHTNGVGTAIGSGRPHGMILPELSVSICILAGSQHLTTSSASITPAALSTSISPPRIISLTAIVHSTASTPRAWCSRSSPLETSREGKKF
jgi:hypothetical protein